MQVGDGGRVPAAQRGEDCGLRQCPALLGVVQAPAERLRTGVRAAGATSAPALAGPFRHGSGRLGVAAANLIAQLVSGSRHQQRTPFRSATAASLSTASLLSEK